MNIELLPLKITTYNLEALQSFVSEWVIKKKKKNPHTTTQKTKNKKRKKKTIFFFDNLLPNVHFHLLALLSSVDKWYYVIRTSSCLTMKVVSIGENRVF